MTRRVADEGPICPVPAAPLLSSRLRSGKYRMTDLGLELHCPRCDEHWPADTEFYYQSAAPGGLNTYCKSCYEEWRDARKSQKAVA